MNKKRLIHITHYLVQKRGLKGDSSSNYSPKRGVSNALKHYGEPFKEGLLGAPGWLSVRLSLCLGLRS